MEIANEQFNAGFVRKLPCHQVSTRASGKAVRMNDIPHFSFPFKLQGKQFAQNEQDTLDDIAACVDLVMLYEPGWREMLPDFGITSLVFQDQPIGGDLLIAQIQRWEPRAHVLFDQMPDVYDPKTLHGRVQVMSREA